ncbi:NUDIX domain-containing protein [Roseovarius sp. CAU 1744]|uniref:NUDIX domain-containing protein n=1 Tax=Roseovarius sp. CAU 1744 TaxID=3140368 RepID=UPI00325C2D52
MSGIVIEDAPADAQSAIAYFAAGLGYAPAECAVIAEGRARPVTVYCRAAEASETTRDWLLEAWEPAWGQIALNAAQEVAQHRSAVPAETLSRMMPMILVRAASRATAAAGAPTDLRSDLHADAVEVLEQHNRHAGFFLTREATLRHPMFDGSQSPPVTREVFVATDAAIVLPYDPVRDRVLLVEQFRMGPFGRGDPHPWMLEPVAGRVDPGETPEATAQRESVEEAGLALGRLEHVSSHYCSLGCSTEYFHCYVGLCDLPDLNMGQGGLDSEDEDIRTHVLPFEQAMALIPSGEAANGPLILCLLWLQRERARLRADAGSDA